MWVASLVLILTSIGSSFADRSLSTTDGLKFVLTDDGIVREVQVGKNRVPTGGASGGFAILDVARARPKNLVPNGDFEKLEGGWPVEWSKAPAYWSLDTSVKHSGTASMRVTIPGDQPVQTPNVSLLERLPVEGDSEYRVEVWFKTDHCFRGGGEPTVPGVYCVEYDKDGKALRQTGYYQPKYAPVMDWFLAPRSLRTLPEARSLSIYMNVYGGYGTAWVDDVAVYEVGSEWETGSVPVRVPLKSVTRGQGDKGARGETLRQEATVDSLGLRFAAEYSSAGPYLRCHFDLEDVTGRDRAIVVRFALPLDALGRQTLQSAAGWTWWDTKQDSRPVNQPKAYHSCYRIPCGDGLMSIYPWSALTSKEAGLSLAVPIGAGPRVHRIEYDGKAKLFSQLFFLGLSKTAMKIPQKASGDFLLYQHDPKWGFRSAARRYYGFFPDNFEKRPGREENLGYANEEDPLWFHAPDHVKNLKEPEDFGRLAKWFWHDHTLYMGFFWQTDHREYPPDDLVIRLLQEWKTKQHPQEFSQWNHGYFDLLGRRSYMTWEDPADFLLHALCFDDKGRILWVGDSAWQDHWSPEGQVTGWGLNMVKYASDECHPSIKNGLLHAIAQKQKDPDWLWNYRSCISMDGISSTAAYRDCRPEHIKTVNHPLTFGGPDHRVAVTDLGWDFNEKVIGPLSRKHGFLVHSNAVCGTPFCAFNFPYVDIGMIECSHNGMGMNERECDTFVRTMAYQKLFRTWFYPAPGEKEEESIRFMFKRELFHALYPSFQSLGQNLALYRPLFLRYLPVVTTLSTAGWEPITYAHTGAAQVGAERFGDPKQGAVYFTVRNFGSEKTKVLLKAERTPLGLGEQNIRLTVTDLLDREPLSFDVSDAFVEVPLEIEPLDTKALRVGTPKGIAQRFAGDARRRLAWIEEDLLGDQERRINKGVTFAASRKGRFLEKASTTPFIAYDNVLLDGDTGYQGDMWQPGEALTLTFDLGAAYEVSALRLWYTPWSPTYGLPAGMMEVSLDTKTWSPVSRFGADLGTTDPQKSLHEHAAAGLKTRCRYVRLQLETWQGYTVWLKEMEVRGKLAERGQIAAGLKKVSDSLAKSVNAQDQNAGLHCLAQAQEELSSLAAPSSSLLRQRLQEIRQCVARAAAALSETDFAIAPLPKAVPGATMPVRFLVRGSGSRPWTRATARIIAPDGWTIEGKAEQDLSPFPNPKSGTGNQKCLDFLLRAPVGLTPNDPVTIRSELTGTLAGEKVVLLDLAKTLVAPSLSARIVLPPHLNPVTNRSPVRVLMTNNAATEVTALARLRTPAGWRTEPPEAIVKLPAGGNGSADFLLATTQLQPEKTYDLSVDLSVRGSAAGTEQTIGAQTKTLPAFKYALAPRVAAPPKVDGVLDDDCWKVAAPLGGFLRTDGKEPAVKTKGFVCYDNDALYLGVLCREPQPELLKAAITKRDDPVYSDDSLEIHFDTGHDHSTFYHLAVNTRNVQFDRVSGTSASAEPSGCDLKWSSAVQVGKDQWVLEMAMPFASLRVNPVQGDTWGFNLCRERQPVGEKSGEWTTWCGGFNQVTAFGHLVFGQG